MSSERVEMSDNANYLFACLSSRGVSGARRGGQESTYRWRGSPRGWNLGDEKLSEHAVGRGEATREAAQGRRLTSSDPEERSSVREFRSHQRADKELRSVLCAFSSRKVESGRFSDSRCTELG